jgi:hypothetical protein
MSNSGETRGAYKEATILHFHGLPITPAKAAVCAIENGYAFVSHAHPDQLALAAIHAKGIAFDNGAFSAWKGGKPIRHWEPYYRWIEEVSKIPKFFFAIIPDVIEGSEEENDAMIAEWPWKGARASIGVPVWHLHESLARLDRLVEQWPRIALGSSGEYSQIGTNRWHNRMAEAMDRICDEKGQPRTQIHGLRQLDGRLVRRYPYSSCDSTNIAQNVGIDSNWTGAYQPKTKEGRAELMRRNIEADDSPITWKPEYRAIQDGLFGVDYAA